MSVIIQIIIVGHLCIVIGFWKRASCGYWQTDKDYIKVWSHHKWNYTWTLYRRQSWITFNICKYLIQMWYSWPLNVLQFPSHSIRWKTCSASAATWSIKNFNFQGTLDVWSGMCCQVYKFKTSYLICWWCALECEHPAVIYKSKLHLL